MEQTEELNEQKPNKWLPYLKNKYVWVLLFFGIWMLFLDNYSQLEHRELDKEIEELEVNKKYYQDEIRKDQHNINLLKDPNQVEKYAREKYFMKKQNEDIYLIDLDSSGTKP
ncbi:MAG: septum formation initiator family protein [Flavobacterium sp.]|jgi:cell division protein DivIC|nr:septum formation initiator family protein [Flavobacterium sp.]